MLNFGKTLRAAARSRSAGVAGLVFLVIVLGSGSGSARPRQSPGLIPWPVEVELGSGEFSLANGTALVLGSDAGSSLLASARIFAAKVHDRFGVRLKVVTIAESPGCGLESVSVRTEADSYCLPCQSSILVGDAIRACGLIDELPSGELPGDEGYKLLVDESVLVFADTAPGFHNGLATLLQLIGDKKSVPFVGIVDYPRFRHRGMLLDSSRSFLPPDVIKRYLDLLSDLKLNVLHWHIVDDQGWRIESKKYPRLHEVGGIVSNMSEEKLAALAEIQYDERGRLLPDPRYSSVDGARDSRGYYTQEELKEIVEYALARQVMIIPEIDVPGHTSAMIAAYPELSCSGEAISVPRVGTLSRNALCPGKEEVYEFLDELFGEVAQIFPGPYVHIGGDEVWIKTWMEAPDNQWLIEEYGYTDKAGLQSYFTNRVYELLKNHGKTMIAWDEVTDHAPEDSVIQAWRRHGYAREAAEAGNDSVVSPTSHCYIDYPQLQFTLKKLYHFEPLPKGLSPELEHHVLGGEVNLWGEWVTLANIDSKAFPRLLAHAEVVWSPAPARDWNDFVKRLKPVRREMEARGVGFGRTWRDVLFAGSIDYSRDGEGKVFLFVTLEP